MSERFGRLRESLKNQQAKTADNLERDKHESWVVYDSSLDGLIDRYSFAEEFNSLLPPESNGLRSYLTEKLKNKKGQAIGIEIAGPGSQLFGDLSHQKLFKKTAGFVLKDIRTKNTKEYDQEVHHQVVEVSDAFSGEGYRTIQKWLGEEKADVLFERMVANLGSFPKEPEYLYTQINRLYKLLSKEGVLFVTAPPLSKDPAVAIHVINWLAKIKKDYGDKIDLAYDFKENGPGLGMMRLKIEKLKDAPDELPNFESKDAKTTKEYFDHLDLKIEDLVGKKVLDVGSGYGAFVRFANSQGADATALDNGNNISDKSFAVINETKTPFIQANAYEIPLPDNTFDFVISHAAIPNIASPVFKDEKLTPDRDRRQDQILEQERRIKSLEEMLRVLKVGGEIRCAPVVGDTETYKFQTNQIREAINYIKAKYPVEIIEEALNHANKQGSFRLIIKKKES